jgi:hypothetical protein
MKRAFNPDVGTYAGGKADSTPSIIRSTVRPLKKVLPVNTDEPTKTTLPGVTLLSSALPVRVPIGLDGDETVRVVKGIKFTVPLSAASRLWRTSKRAFGMTICPVDRSKAPVTVEAVLALVTFVNVSTPVTPPTDVPTGVSGKLNSTSW